MLTYLEAQHGQIILPDVPQIRFNTTPESGERHLIRRLCIAEVLVHLTLPLGAGFERFLDSGPYGHEGSSGMRRQGKVNGCPGNSGHHGSRVGRSR